MEILIDIIVSMNLISQKNLYLPSNYLRYIKNVFFMSYVPTNGSDLEENKDIANSLDLLLRIRFTDITNCE